MTDIRAITIRQPYASLVAHGIKRWATRSRRTNWRGPVAIHAGKRWEPGWRGVWVDPHGDGPDVDRYWLLTEKLGLEPTEDINGSDYWTAWDGGRLPTGAVVAVADLTDSIPIVGEDDDLHIEEPCIEVRPRGATNAGLWLWIRGKGEDEDRAEHISDQLPCGHWTPGNWAWRLDNVRRLPQPIPAKGRLGLWLPDDDLARLIDGEGGLT